MGFMVGSCSDDGRIVLLLAGAFDGFFVQMLDLHFFKEISQNSCIFRSWTFTAGVLGVVGALKWSHFMTLLGLFSRMHF